MERSLRGEDIPTNTLVKQHPEWGLYNSITSRHKTICMGLKPLEQGRRTHHREVLAPPANTDLTTPDVWVPTNKRDWARSKIVSAIGELDQLISGGGATAAYFKVRLDHLQTILLEADKAGGAPLDRMKSYAEEVNAKLDSKGNREITQIVTMTEKVTENVEPAIEGQVVEVPCAQ